MPQGDLIHARLGPFDLRERVGRGGFSEIYRAEHVEDGSQAAVKVLRAEWAQDRARVKAFQREFAYLSRLHHAGLPQARRFGEIRGRAAFVTDFVPGRSVIELIERKESFDIVGCFVAMVGLASHVHEHMIIHNDLKPENFILQPSGRLSLVDFGNACDPVRMGFVRRFWLRMREGRTVKVTGTPTYVAPEILLGYPPSFASDCYSLGVCAHKLLTGEFPFPDDRRTVRLLKAVCEQAPSIGKKLPRLSDELASILDRCLRKDPEQRPENGTVLRSMLQDHFGSGMHLRPSDISREIQER